jgi:hypothetical protein
MTPVSPVIPGMEGLDVIYAKDQPEYNPLPTVRSSDGKVTSRWAFTPAEKEAIANGAELYLTLWTFGQPLQPVLMAIANESQANNYLASVL